MPPSLTRRRFLASAVALALPGPGRADEPAKGLVTGQAEGAAAGNGVRAAGGTAVDAIVSGALAAGVVAVPPTGIGGYGGPLPPPRPDGKVFALDFNGTAP